MSIIYVNPFQFATPTGPTDPNFSDVALLLRGDGTNGSTTIVDSSPTPKSVTAVGNAKISTAILDPFGQSTGVITISAVGNPTIWGYLDITRIPFAVNESFTLETWVYKVARDANDYSNIFASNTNSDGQSTLGNTQIGYDSTTEGSVHAYFGAGFGVPFNTGTAVSTNTWQHIAYVRDGANCAVYVDGVLQGSGTRDVAFNVERIGATGIFALRVIGYLSNVRITKGVARYTSNFTRPTTPFPDS